MKGVKIQKDEKTAKRAFLKEMKKAEKMLKNTGSFVVFAHSGNLINCAMSIPGGMIGSYITAVQNLHEILQGTLRKQ